MEIQSEPRRGPGRPPGSTNSPRLPPLSPAKREELKRELGVQYRQAITHRAVVEARVKGIHDLIIAKLGRDGLAELRSQLIVEHETATAAADEIPRPPQLRPVD